jgi:hypothetical protein
MVERPPLGPWIDVPLLDDETTVVTDEFSPVRAFDQVLRAALRTLPDPFLLGLLISCRLALALPLAARPCHRIFIVVRSTNLNPW